MCIPPTSRAWELIGADLFTHNGQEYLILVDYFSNFPEVIKLGKTSSEAIIRHFKKIFSIHGIPDCLITDCGPQFLSEEFKDFTREWQFHH